MTLQVSDFDIPKSHPFGMLEGMRLKHTLENERFLAWMLVQCIEAGKWIAVKTSDPHETLIECGLLAKEGDHLYSLTKKAKGLLYCHYGKDEEPQSMTASLPVTLAFYDWQQNGKSVYRVNA